LTGTLGYLFFFQRRPAAVKWMNTAASHADEVLNACRCSVFRNKGISIVKKHEKIRIETLGSL
jgi:hypothetical protein